MYLLKDISRLSGASKHTIKHYLRIGFISETGRSKETNFRFFDDSTVERLKKIIEYRGQKLSLKKIKELLEK